MTRREGLELSAAALLAAGVPMGCGARPGPPPPIAVPFRPALYAAASGRPPS